MEGVAHCGGQEAPTICGIDPGKKGGIVALSLTGDLVEMMKMPLVSRIVDCDIIKLFLLKHNPLHIVMEFPQAFVGNAGPSMLSYGRDWGRLEGCIETLGFPYTLVRPTKWQNKMLMGTEKKLTTKERGLAIARRLWPHETFVPPGCRTFHDGLTDAALIGEYARRHLGIVPPDTRPPADIPF